MNLHPVHFAPHHTGHLPLCGAQHVTHGGTHQLIIITSDRDETTCFGCIDQYTERALTPEQVASLDQHKADMDATIEALEEALAFDTFKHTTLHVLEHMIEDTPWWNLKRRFQLRRAHLNVATLTLDDMVRESR